MKYYSGFTLIELLVVVAIMAFMALVAAPFATQWIDGINVQRGRDTVAEAYGQLRAFALRNTGAVGAGTATAVMVTNGTTVCVTRSVPADTTCSGADVVWTRTTKATIQFNSTSPQCIALDALGMVVQPVINGVACTATLTANIVGSSQNIQYVLR